MSKPMDMTLFEDMKQDCIRKPETSTRKLMRERSNDVQFVPTRYICRFEISVDCLYALISIPEELTDYPVNCKRRILRGFSF